MQKDTLLKGNRKYIGRRPGAILLVDIVKAFNSVDRVKIRYKCSEIDLTLGFMAQMTCGMRVRLEGCDHEWIWMDRGTCQGLAIAAPLFNIAMNHFPCYAVGE